MTQVTGHPLKRVTQMAIGPLLQKVWTGTKALVSSHFPDMLQGSFSFGIGQQGISVLLR